MASEPSIAVPVARQVVTVHDVEPWTRSSSFARRDAPYFAFQRSRVRRCGAVIVVSDVTRDQTIETLHVDPSRLHVIPEGVSSVFTPEPSVDDERLRAAAGVGERPYVLWVGSLAAYDPRKALDVLVDAVAASTAKPTLVLAGAGGAGQAEVRRLAEQHHLAVSFPGFVPDETLAALYRGANAAVLASLHEGFGLPALEAMACGAVTIVSRAGNLPDLVDVAAIVVPPGDRQALTNAIDESSTDTVLRARLRGRGPVVAARYRWGRVAAMTRDVYESVASRR
jgi:glycosyltransferase involved in cell wall biosynthesis